MMSLEDKTSAVEPGKTSSPEPVSSRKPASFFHERPPRQSEVAPQLLRRWSRRDLLLFGAGAVAAVAGGGSLLPQPTLERVGIIDGDKNWPGKEWLLNRAL